MSILQRQQLLQTSAHASGLRLSICKPHSLYIVDTEDANSSAGAEIDGVQSIMQPVTSHNELCNQFMSQFWRVLQPPISHNELCMHQFMSQFWRVLQPLISHNELCMHVVDAKRRSLIFSLCTQAGTDVSYRVMHGLSGQHHDALCGRQQLHPSILRLAGIALSLIGLLVLVAHVLPPLTSFSPNDLDSCYLVWMLPLQAKNAGQFWKDRTLFLD